MHRRSAHVVIFGDSSVLGDKLTALSRTWELRTAFAPWEVLRLLRDDSPPDLVLFLPGESLDPVLELCRSIKLDRRTRFVPVVVIRAGCHELRVNDVHASGVDDFIPCWATLDEIRQRVDKCVRLKRATDLLEDSETVIVALANAIEGKDECTCGHVDRVSAYCAGIGKRLGLSSEELYALRTGGIVHDIGKVGIPDQILNKPGELTDEEMTVMRRHPVIGHDILKPLRTFRNVIPIVRWHHERPNGTGYPDGLSGERLPLLPRIAAVADVFDAISTDRPYRKAMPLEQCRRIMMEEAARGNLDAMIVQLHFETIGTSAGKLNAALPIPA